MKLESPNSASFQPESKKSSHVGDYKETFDFTVGGNINLCWTNYLLI